MLKIFLCAVLLLGAAQSPKSVDGPKPLAPLTIEAGALEQIRAAQSEAQGVRQAANVAERLLTDRSSECFTQSLNILKEAAAAREARAAAIELAYRYQHKVPPEYQLDLRTGVFAPPKDK